MSYIALKNSERYQKKKKKVKEGLISLGTRRTIKSWDKTFSEVYPIGNLEEWGAVAAEKELGGRMSKEIQQEQVIAL